MNLDACILRNNLRERLKQSLIMMFHREQNLKIHLMMQLKKCNIIFTTTPQFLEGSIKTAIKNPSVKILNCSVDTNHQCIRTYYARLFEAKFLSGLVAGALCKNGKIGYMADYPICGMIANINAFAIGVKIG